MNSARSHPLDAREHVPFRRGVARLAPWATLVCGACLHPGAATPSPAGATSTPASGTSPGTGDATSAPGTTSTTGSTKRLSIWDGAHIRPRNVGTGRSGRLDYWDGGAGWANCHGSADCESTLKAVAGAGFRGGKSLRFHARGSGWLGAGWSWFEWYPPTAGSDLSSYERLTFQVKVESASHEAAPDRLAVSLVSSSTKKASNHLLLRKYEEHFDDGQWHKIAIPLADFAKDEGMGQFDPKTVWEFQIASMNDAPRDFNVYIDEIAAEST